MLAPIAWRTPPRHYGPWEQVVSLLTEGLVARGVYRKYNGDVRYVAISDADRSPDLTYLATVHHGIDLRGFTFCERPDDYVLFFGRIHPDKGAKEAIEIARRAGRRLMLAGIIQDQNYFQREIAPAIDGHTVQYLGSAGPDARDRLLGHAYALLHPINFAEPFGLSVVEAMACGTPTIAFPRGSMLEIVRDGETGFLVRDIDAAVDAINRIGAVSRTRCREEAERRFSAERMVDDYLRLYTRVWECRES
jgi:glycosyltransferase involved in cell wall biosynthesis